MALGTIPNDVRVPLVYIEIDNSQALSGNIAQDQNVMLFGQMTDAGGDAGTATPLQVVEVPGCGHAPALNVPEQFALVDGFLSDT